MKFAELPIATVVGAPETTKSPLLEPDTAIELMFNTAVPEFWMVNVRAIGEPTFPDPKSVKSVVDGVASPSRMVTAFPCKLISEPTVVTLKVQVPAFKLASLATTLTVKEDPTPETIVPGTGDWVLVTDPQLSEALTNPV